MKEADFEYMKEAISADLAVMLAKDYDLSITDTLDLLYSSVTYDKLCNPDTGLYFQSSKYIYSYLKNELDSGTFA